MRNVLGCPRGLPARPVKVPASGCSITTAASANRWNFGMMIGTAQMNKYTEQHAFEVGTDCILYGALLSLYTNVRPGLIR